MDDLSSSSRAFHSLSSLSPALSRRSRPAPIPPRAVGFAELAPMTVVAEDAEGHRALAIEQTESAIDHFLELSRRWAEVRRRHEGSLRFHEEGGPFSRSRAALEEKHAWERWMSV